jgi:hypothetical protein
MCFSLNTLGYLNLHFTLQWSYGVLLWELMSYGALPYALVNDVHELIKELLTKSCRLSRPPKCSVVVYEELMLRCWHTTPQHRPSIEEICTQLSKNIEQPFSANQVVFN